MFNNNNITEKSPSRFSYLIQPITPCIFGTENYDDKSENEDEFFITAGGIVHSCPNIYELSIENEYQYRKLQSCEHLIFINQHSTSINNNLNTYDTKFDHYSIIPRFQPISSSLSTNSINSEIELYKERHANGFSQKYDNILSTYSSFLPTTWKSDSLSIQSSLSTSINSNKRSRSFDIPISSFFISL
jgi:hypothetical protein